MVPAPPADLSRPNTELIPQGVDPVLAWQGEWEETAGPVIDNVDQNNAAAGLGSTEEKSLLLPVARLDAP